MKNGLQSLVRQFHERFGAPAAERPTLIPTERAQLRVRLIAEELQEYARAAGLGVDILVIEERYVCAENGPPAKLAPPTPDLVEVADALGDLLYVVLGSGVEHGIALDPVFREIHRSNMTKDGGGKDGGGKILKGPRYEPPNLQGIVADQQAGKGEEPRRSKSVEQALVAGFRGGWAAALREIASDIESQETRARLSAGGRQVSLSARPLVKMLLARASQPPTPQLVAMKPGETPEQATARPGAIAEAPPAAPAEGAFPNAQEALPVLAGLLAAIGGDRVPDRAKRAEWIALRAFGQFAQHCAKLDGFDAELEREAETLRLLVLAPHAQEGHA